MGNEKSQLPESGLPGARHADIARYIVYVGGITSGRFDHPACFQIPTYIHIRDVHLSLHEITDEAQRKDAGILAGPSPQSTRHAD